MGKKSVTKTWDEFWGPLFFLRFHENNPERWTKREIKAEWIFNNLHLEKNAEILDLGCGDGLLDICLARLGAKVTAIDRMQSVILAAQKEPGGNLVNFQTSDIRELEFEPKSFNVVLMLELSGLMSRVTDRQLVDKAYDWLIEGGFILIDNPKDPTAEPVHLKRKFDDGVLEIHSEYNPQTRYQNIQPRFYRKNGELVELDDPYRTTIQEKYGVPRYIYQRDELRVILFDRGFEATVADKYFSEGHWGIIGKKPPGGKP
jgi:SAM-dependent methyltransferase